MTRQTLPGRTRSLLQCLEGGRISPPLFFSAEYASLCDCRSSYFLGIQQTIRVCELMKNLMILLTLCAGVGLTLGCGDGPGTATKEEADQSMEETMNMDVSPEDDPAAAP